MENTSIYDLIIIISTDYFIDYLFPNEELSEINSIQSVARNEMKTILNGGDNFYLYADFNKDTVDKTAQRFYESLSALNISDSIFNKVKMHHELINKTNVSDAFETACSEIIITASHLYWLETDLLSIPLTDELVDIVSIIEPCGINLGSSLQFDEDDWLSSESDWDQYIMSLMDGIDEAPFTKLQSIDTFYSKFDFLKQWISLLTNKQIRLLLTFILNESQSSLEEVNKCASAEIKKIINSIYHLPHQS